MSGRTGKDREKHYDQNGKCIHDGHRQRLLKTAYETGMEGFSDVQVMEMLLCYIFPRGDVNPLAHSLLKTFGTLTQTIDASLEELKSVKGMGEAAAMKLKVFGELFYNYTEDKMRKKVVLSSFVEIVDCVEQSLRLRNTEHVLLLALSHAHVLIRSHLVSLERSGEVSLNMLEFANFLSSTHPAAVVVAHNHPYGQAYPSGNDDDAFERLKEMTENYGINFVDAYIVGENGVYSHREGRLVREYHDLADLKNKFAIASGIVEFQNVEQG